MPLPHMPMRPSLRWLASIALLASVLVLAGSAPDLGDGRPEPTFHALMRRGDDRFKEERWPEAVNTFERAVAVNPVDGRAWRMLGNSLLRAGRNREAIPPLQKAIELGSGFPWASAYNIACAYARLGDRDAALTWLQKSLDMGFRKLDDIRSDPDLVPLREDATFRRLAGVVDTGSLTRDEGWRFDLRLLARELERLHYDPHRVTSKADFDAYVARLDAGIPAMTDAEIKVGFMRLTRMMGDGHTHMMPSFFGMDGIVGAEFYQFKEGLFVTGAAGDGLAGARVVRIGEHGADEVMKALDAVVSQDNSMGLLWIGPNLIRRPAILNGLGLIPSPDALPLTLRDAKGAERSVTLRVSDDWRSRPWVRARKETDALFDRNPESSYWFEALPDGRTVYFQFNAVMDQPGETLEAFTGRLFRFIDENPVERLVIDMRRNPGGNNFLSRPLIERLVKSEKINRRGHLFVLTGRNTFSAAMCTAAWIERYTEAIFAGEPTGSRPNFVGETNILTLPYSGMRASISDLYWENSIAMDYRTWIAPEIYVPPTFEAYRSGRDPALEAVLAYRADG